MRRLAVAGAMLAATLAAGCGDLGKVKVSSWPPRPVTKVDEIIFRLTPPTALNWDDLPGPDGFQVQVHFFQVDRPLPVTIDGALDIALFEGRPSPDQLAEGRPFRTWVFEGDQLRKHLVRSIVGWGYAMRLDWAGNPPKASAVTLLARFRPAKGKAPFKTTAPLHVAMKPQ